MRADKYIEALLEELRSPRTKDAEASIRSELAKLKVEAPTPKEIKAEAVRSQTAPKATEE